MSLQILFEDRHGNAMDEDGREPVQMEVDQEAFPLDNVTNFNIHAERKPPEKPIKQATTVLKKPATTKALEVYEKGLNPGQAAKIVYIPRRTGYNWYNVEQLALQERLEQDLDQSYQSKDSEEDTVKAKPGRKKILGPIHKEYLKKLYDESPSTTVDEALDSLTDRFEGMRVSPATVYKFMTNDCALSLKKAYFYPAERNSPGKIEQRYQWMVEWSKTDLDFEGNCIFIDEAAFHINLKRSMAWAKKGERTIVETPTTRAKMTTNLGAISPFGVINVKVRRPYQAPSKKRKLPGASKAIKTTGTVTGHYFNFVADALDVMDGHEQFKNFYIIMDNVPIYKHEDISKYVINRGYGCVYLPPYLPELNPIEQFWSVVKSKFKREKLLESETLSSRIADACNSILYSDLQGFCRYSASKWQVCFDKQPL